MNRIESLRDIVGFNNSFKTAVNLYLSLNKPDKVLGYIPTKSSVAFLGEYLKAIIDGKEQATLLVGPYGKGKSHLLLVLLSIISMERSDENSDIVRALAEKVASVDETGKTVAGYINKLWDSKKFLPVLITDSTGDLNQAFLFGLNDALRRNGLQDLSPDTYYSVALDRLDDWEANYPETFLQFEKQLSMFSETMTELRTGLKVCSKDSLDIFKTIYPTVTAGSEFNPMAVSSVLPLYKSVSERLVEDYGYSGIYIVFDEFSKFIESQSGEAAGNNMKLIQDVCELATESHNAQVFFTMVAHKSIKEYGKYLSTDIINSFTGIEGRIIEKFFVTSSKNNYELIRNAIVKKEAGIETVDFLKDFIGESALEKFYQLPAFKSKFQVQDFADIVLRGCYPLNPVAAYLLLNISEKVAQNERTLFTFISNDEPHSMARYIEEHTKEDDWTIGADLIYDYFSPLFKKEVTNEYVHNIWLSAEYVLDKCSSIEQRKIVKALAIVLIVNKEDEIPADGKYLSYCVNVCDFATVISELENAQYIQLKKSTGTFTFKTRAGAELRTEIRKQKEIKGDNVNYPKVLMDVTGKYYVIPRKYNTVHKMTRYFTNEYMDVNAFLSISSSEAILSGMKGDGKVLTLYGLSNIKQDEVKRHVGELADSRLVVVCPKKKINAQEQLREYEIIHELRDNAAFTSDNEILKKELPLLLEDLTAEVEGILSQCYEDADTHIFYFANGKTKALKYAEEEHAVNSCCEIVYFKSPIINNEMVNRSVISTAQTKKARNTIVQTILNHCDDETFYTGSSQEASVYRALFCQTGIKQETPAPELREIIDVINRFIDSCCDTKVCISKLVDELTGAPYGMRRGVLPLYLSYVLSNRREDIIIYFADSEVQLNSDIVINMCESAEDYQMYVSKEDLQKEKYISELNTLFDVEDNRNLTANRIKNIVICMQRWFRALPQASRNMVSIDDYVQDNHIRVAMVSIKKSLQKVEFNPFEILFVTFPDLFGTDSLEETFRIVDECKTLFDDYYDWLKNKTATIIHELWGSKKKQDLYHILHEWYEKQSKRSKQGLYSGRMTNMMSSIETLNVYNDSEIALKIAKAVTDVYLENWNSGAVEEFAENAKIIKSEIEAVKDEDSTGEMTLSFVGKNGSEITKLYSYASESSGSVLRNIIEDTLDEYDDLSVNDRVSILLEMIEKIIK